MKLIQDPSGRQLGVIQWHPDVHKSLKDAIEYRSTLNPTHQPMLVRIPPNAFHAAPATHSHNLYLNTAGATATMGPGASASLR